MYETLPEWFAPFKSGTVSVPSVLLLLRLRLKDVCQVSVSTQRINYLKNVLVCCSEQTATVSGASLCIIS
ncbi:hypothetical protein DNTS_023040 [Danionella cerebrum]|uniref:Uncharacterized protein n=1 Tax=Danionella cerebrum TaxID=2873325 RepID=A0A553Q576_9TELE|nr:hypothetical protein DNTS_023040 [Danionella translucida]